MVSYMMSRSGGRNGSKIEVKIKAALFRAAFVFFSRGWIRTSDQLINSQLRYRCATRERDDKA